MNQSATDRPPTGRSLDEILNIHGLPLQCFEGAIVYDLGCGHSDIGTHLAMRGIKAVVTGFDRREDALNDSHPPTMTGFDRQDEDPLPLTGNTNKVFAHLDALPVENESADIVVATYSLPLFGDSVQEIVDFFREATRVVRVDGILSISPVVAHGGGSIKSTSTFNERSSTVKTEVDRIMRSPNWIPLSLPWEEPQTLTARKIMAE